MSKALKVFLSAVTNGLIAFFGAYGALLANMDAGQTLADINDIALAICFVAGGATAAKDVHAALNNFGD